MIVTGSIFDAVRQFLSFVFRSVASLLQVFPKKQSYLLLLKQTFEKLSNIKERHSVFMILLPISGAFKSFCLKSVVFIEAEVNQKFDAKLYLTFATYFCFCYVMIIGEISETDLFFYISLQHDSIANKNSEKANLCHIIKDNTSLIMWPTVLWSTVFFSDYLYKCGKGPVKIKVNWLWIEKTFRSFFNCNLS